MRAATADATAFTMLGSEISENTTRASQWKRKQEQQHTHTDRACVCARVQEPGLARVPV